jgi:hypothetical protein
LFVQEYLRRSKSTVEANLIKIQANCKLGANPALELSDWVAFLSSEKYGALSNVMGSFALAASLFAILYSATSRSNTAENWSVVIGAVVIMSMTWIVIRLLGRRAKHAEKILEQIMRGSLSNSEDIRKAWSEK